MDKPLVSICIPAYKAAGFISETLSSVRAQTYQNWELIVVEDGSDDGTEKIVRAFSQTVAQPVQFVRHETNQGLPGTRNTAIHRASGEWIALIDSDDLWTADHLERAIAQSHSSTADLIHSGVMMFDSDSGRDMELRAPSPEARTDFPRSLFLGQYIIQPSSTLIRRKRCLEVGGFDPTCRYVEDREFWLRLVRVGVTVSYVDAITCRYRQHAQAMTKNAAAMAEGVAGVYERHLDWDAMPRNLRLGCAASAWYSAGRIVFRKNPRLARRHFARALHHRLWSPRLVGYWSAATLMGLFKSSDT